MDTARTLARKDKETKNAMRGDIEGGQCAAAIIRVKGRRSPQRHGATRAAGQIREKCTGQVRKVGFKCNNFGYGPPTDDPATDEGHVGHGEFANGSMARARFIQLANEAFPEDKAFHVGP